MAERARAVDSRRPRSKPRPGNLELTSSNGMRPGSTDHGSNVDCRSPKLARGSHLRSVIVRGEAHDDDAARRGCECFSATDRGPADHDRPRRDWIQARAAHGFLPDPAKISSQTPQPGPGRTFSRDPYPLESSQPGMCSSPETSRHRSIKRVARPPSERAPSPPRSYTATSLLSTVDGTFDHRAPLRMTAMATPTSSGSTESPVPTIADDEDLLVRSRGRPDPNPRRVAPSHGDSRISRCA